MTPQCSQVPLQTCFFNCKKSLPFHLTWFSDCNWGWKHFFSNLLIEKFWIRCPSPAYATLSGERAIKMVRGGNTRETQPHVWASVSHRLRGGDCWLLKLAFFSRSNPVLSMPQCVRCVDAIAQNMWRDAPVSVFPSMSATRQKNIKCSERTACHAIMCVNVIIINHQLHRPASLGATCYPALTVCRL